MSNFLNNLVFHFVKLSFKNKVKWYLWGYIVLSFFLILLGLVADIANSILQKAPIDVFSWDSWVSVNVILTFTFFFLTAIPNVFTLWVFHLQRTSSIKTPIWYIKLKNYPIYFAHITLYGSIYFLNQIERDSKVGDFLEKFFSSYIQHFNYTDRINIFVLTLTLNILLFPILGVINLIHLKFGEVVFSKFKNS